MAPASYLPNAGGTEKQRRTTPKEYAARAQRFMIGRPLARVRLVLVDGGKTWLCQRTAHRFDGGCLVDPSPRTPLTGRSADAWETWYTAKHVGRSYFPPPGRDPGVWQRAKPDIAYKRCKPLFVTRHVNYPEGGAGGQPGSSLGRAGKKAGGKRR